MSICSFGDATTEDFFVRGLVKRSVGWRNVKSVVRRKLDMLHYAVRLLDLSAPPGNRLEALRGKFAGYYSIRVNDQWRIVFCWTDAGPAEVRVCDYH